MEGVRPGIGIAINEAGETKQEEIELTVRFCSRCSSSLPSLPRSLCTCNLYTAYTEDNGGDANYDCDIRARKAAYVPRRFSIQVAGRSPHSLVNPCIPQHTQRGVLTMHTPSSDE